MDESSILSKISRLTQTTKIAGGMAGRLLAEKYLNIPINDDDYAKLLLETLGHLKGPLMKAAQFLCTIPDTLPDEYYQLLQLQSQAPAMGVPFVKRRMQSELGTDWNDHFSSFDLKAHAAASLGQVHKATLKTGEDVAVKLQYPSMEALTETDLAQLKIFFALYEHFSKTINTEHIFEEIKDHLMEELDYIKEAENMKAYHSFFKDDDFVRIPNVYEDLSTKRLLMMDWMDGKNILTLTDHPSKDHLGGTLFRAWYAPLYKNGMLHGDPHPGNYLVNKDNQLILLDFGCIRRFDSNFIEGVKTLYKALEKDDLEMAVDAYTLWGFNNLSKNLIEIITSWAKLLYDPLLDDIVRPIQKNISGQDSFKLAKKIHQEVRREGGITPPKEFVFMDRAAVGIGSVLMRLDAKNNWHQLFNTLINE